MSMFFEEIKILTEIKLYGIVATGCTRSHSIMEVVPDMGSSKIDRFFVCWIIVLDGEETRVTVRDDEWPRSRIRSILFFRHIDKFPFILVNQFFHAAGDSPG